MDKKIIKRSLVPYLFLFLVITLSLFLTNMLNRKINKLSYDEFISKIDTVETVVITPNSNSGIYSITGKMKGYGENETYQVSVPYSEGIVNKLLDLEEKYEFTLTTEKDPTTGTFAVFLFSVLPMLIIVGLGFYLLTRQMGGANKSMDFGRSRAKLSNGNNKVTFKNVAGLQEEKEEVKELIDFLKDPTKFTQIGARIPK